MEKYIQLAKKLNAEHAVFISPDDIYFDKRTILKCRWGCGSFADSIKCSPRGTTFQERVEIVKSYKNILVVHSHDNRELYRAVLEIERRAFLDGYYFAFALKGCALCSSCAIQRGLECPHPNKIRPCDQMFGIDVYKTVRNLGLPCDVLQSKNDVQNRYGFVLID